MNPKLLKKALGSITGLADTGIDSRLSEMAAAKEPKVEVEMEGEGAESEAELTEDEVSKLRALLATMEG